MGSAVASAPATGLCVEFLGLPGAGKSTLSHAVADLLRTRGIPVTEPTYRLTHASPVVVRHARKLWYAVWSMLRAPEQVTRWMRVLRQSRQARISDWWILTANWFYLLGIVRRRTRMPGIHLLDQGLFQALWSFGYTARDRGVLSAWLVPRLRTVLPPGAVVVIVEAAAATACQRLRGRYGHSRLGGDLAGENPETSMARASIALRQVEDAAAELARQDRIVLHRVLNEGDESLHAGVAALASALTERLSSADPQTVSREPHPPA